MYKIILILIFSSVLLLNILFLINNGLDQKYLIEVFDKGDDILELKKIANQKLKDSNTIIIMNLILFSCYITFNWFYNKKKLGIEKRNNKQ